MTGRRPEGTIGLTLTLQFGTSTLRVMQRPRIRASWLVWTIVVWMPPVAHSGGNRLEDIPLDSWVYDAVFELSTLGHFGELLLHTRPYTRGDVAEAIAELPDGAEALTPGEAILWNRLQDEFHEELAAAEHEEIQSPQRVRLGAGPTARADHTEDGYSKNRVGFDVTAAFTDTKHLAARTRLRMDSDGRFGTQFGGQYWRNKFTAWIVDQAVISARFGRLAISFGRESWRWGRSPRDAMLMSDHSPPFDGLRVVYHGGRWGYAFHTTRLDGMTTNEEGPVNRYLSAHRVNWRPHTRLELALSEVIVFGGPGRHWDWYYLNPLLPYYWEQLNQGQDDNPLWNIEVSWRAMSGLELYGEWMIDDFQIDFVTEPHQFGVLTGVAWWPRPCDNRLLINAEYQRINTFVYGQNRPWNRYLHYYDFDGNAIGIGSNLGTDADRISIRPRWHQSGLFDFVGMFEYVRRGADRLTTPQQSGVPLDVPFPSGTVERTLSCGLGVHAQQGAHIIVDLLAGYETVDNVGNMAGRGRSGPFVHFKLASLWWATLGI